MEEREIKREWRQNMNTKYFRGVKRKKETRKKPKKRQNMREAIEEAREIIAQTEEKRRYDI